LILGPIGEEGLRRTLIMSKGNILALFNSPISFALIGISALSLLTPVIMTIIGKRGKWMGILRKKSSSRSTHSE
ncbi:MAG: hypothetical protein Q4A52_08400, partial [Bacillota bacterium]|nr:hypothetical protein [Bacillota bacterium]